MEQKTYYIETYGCQMNVYDSELVSNMMKLSGYKQTDNLEIADAIFLNTCSIREKAEETVHNRLNNFQHLKRKNPSMLIGVLGCMAQNLKDVLLEDKPYVDIILGPDSYRNLPKIIKDRENIELSSSLIQPVKEIKSIGVFKVILNLHSEIESSITIKLLPEALIK